MIYISFFKTPYLTLVRCWIVKCRTELSKYYLMMSILVKRQVDTQTHHQIWLRGKDKVDTGRRFSLNVSPFIIWSSPNWEVMSSIFEPSKVVLSPVYQLLDIALKSPIAAIKKRLIAKKASRIRSKLSQKFWKFSLDWFGDLYKETKFQFLSLSFIAMVIHSLY